MIHHWKVLDLEITNFNYHHHPTYTVETIQSQSSRYVLRGYYFLLREGVEYPTSGASIKAKPGRAEQ